MTFDDGAGSQFRTSHEDFRSKVAALLEERGIGFKAACKAAGVDPGGMQTAIEQGTYGLPGTLTILSQFLAGLGADIGWLMAGENRLADDLTERRLSIRKLTWEFMLRDSHFPWAAPSAFQRVRAPPPGYETADFDDAFGRAYINP